MAEEFDLFGERIITGKRKLGRPEHTPSDENRNRIIMFLSFGWTKARIAAALDLTTPTLRKHYFPELSQESQAADRLKAVRFSMLFAQMKKGNIGAHREFDRLAEREMMMIASARFGDGDEAPKEKAEMRRGKKEQQSIDAEGAGLDTGWGSDLQSGPSVKH